MARAILEFSQRREVTTDNLRYAVSLACKAGGEAEIVSARPKTWTVDDGRIVFPIGVRCSRLSVDVEVCFAEFATTSAK
ncbi:MAG: hypothetical protein ABI811_22890 [Acidobacteriota bacterium]